MRRYHPPPTISRPPGEVSTSKLSLLLRDRYYIGEIAYKDEPFDGRHEAIVDRELFMRVQDILEDSGHAGERKRIYESCLKGSIFGGECYVERGITDHRMLIQRAIGRNKAEYFYFFCSGGSTVSAPHDTCRSTPWRMPSSITTARFSSSQTSSAG